MLASDEKGASLDALRFSLASDIVELVVLTCDEAFLQTLREAVGGARRLWHVLSADKVSDLLIAGDVGILVLDVLALQEAPSVFIGQIKRQFPDLVVVVAGNRDCENALSGLISKGLVYRFIHKPMSPGRAKLFAEAAVRKYEGGRKLAPPVPSIARRPRSTQRLLMGAAMGALGLAAIIFWALHKNAADDSVPPQGAAAAQSFMANVVAAGSLTLVKSVQPRYPKNAGLHRTGGWVELDFTVTETGTVRDIAVHAAGAPGMFEEEAIRALSKWRYEPVVRNGKAVARRARIRIRFAPPG